MKRRAPDLLDNDHDRQMVVKLLADLAVALAERDEAERVQRPVADRFHAAHVALASLPPRPSITKPERLAAYDARVRAGHAWHPYRHRLRQAVRWEKEIRKELKFYE